MFYGIITSTRKKGDSLKNNKDRINMKFEDLKINDKIKRALKDMDYINPSPIQEKAIPLLLEGHDIIGCAQTGTGKTCAFMIPIINNLIDEQRDGIKALILTPTRELAIQIYENAIAYSKYTKLKSLAIYGGVKEGTQIKQLKAGVNILIATPGRLLDFMGQGIVKISHIKFLVLDEADRMLDMGFINDVKKIINKAPLSRQTLFFSATMPKEIKELSHTMLKDPKDVSVDPPASTVDKIKQELYHIDKTNKSKLLIDMLKKDGIYRALVFTRTKHGADKLTKELVKNNIKASAIHGDKSQNQRQKALQEFKAGETQVLVATDIAARGIDIDALEMVINYDLPEQPENYVHRIGRTARNGKEGVAISFCCIDEQNYLKDIEKTANITIPVVKNHNYPMKVFIKTEKKQQPQRNQQKKIDAVKNNTFIAKKAKSSKTTYKSVHRNQTTNK